MTRRTLKEIDTAIEDINKALNELTTRAEKPNEILQTTIIGLMLIQYETLRELRIKNDRDEWKDNNEIRRRQGYYD